MAMTRWRFMKQREMQWSAPEPDSGPNLIECKTYRQKTHSTGVLDNSQTSDTPLTTAVAGDSLRHIQRRRAKAMASHVSTNRFITVVLVVLWLPAGLWAQVSRGTITGVVQDPMGTVIPGTVVTVTNQGAGSEIEVTSQRTGLFCTAVLGGHVQRFGLGQRVQASDHRGPESRRRQHTVAGSHPEGWKSDATHRSDRPNQTDHSKERNGACVNLGLLSLSSVS